MGLVSKPTELTESIRKEVKANERGNELTSSLLDQFNQINSIDYFPIREVEEIMLNQAKYEFEKLNYRHTYPRDIPRFSPSSADKCERELFYKNLKVERDKQTMHPFQRRWTRNSSAVHEAVQKQLLESQFKLKNPSYKVHLLENGLPAWEKNLEDWKVITHNGVQFVVFGMMDGILEYKDVITFILFFFMHLRVFSSNKVKFEYNTISVSLHFSLQ